MAEECAEQLNGSPAGADVLGDIDELRRRIQALQVDADKRLRAIVDERPLLVLGAAVAVGFLLGRALRRV
jgi:ElaB/YqjD/DUF883 family membrane-anchored ribosome-binding protein